MLLPFGRALTSSLIEPLVLRLPASERWRDMRRGWVRVLCSRRLMIFWHDSTAPPEHSLSRCSETAGRVKKGLGFGMWIRSGYKKPQSTSAHCRSLRCSASVRSFAFGSARTSFLLDAFTTYTNGWIGRGTGVSPREDNPVGLVELSFSNPAGDIVSRFTPWRQSRTPCGRAPGLSPLALASRPQFPDGFGVIL